ncbi:MAG: DUF6807 family protein [Planctomycetota bacterium]|jgi:hypothetical protein
MNRTKLVAVLLAVIFMGSVAFGAGFSWMDTEGKYLDLSYNGRKVTRYMYDYDESNEQRTFETYKVFHHAFDEKGENLLTNGPDGEKPYTQSVKYPHHRGIFIGWNKLQFEGKSYDTWHMSKGVRQVHQEFLSNKEDTEKAISTVLIHWKNGQGKVMLEEKRTITVHKSSDRTIVQLDFETELKALNGEVYLNGDPEHAGFQYRPHDYVAKGSAEVKAKYMFHKEGIDPKKDKDLPWVAMEYGLNAKRYSVQYMSDPANPNADAVYSAYRDYGRFGEFFKHTIGAGQTLKLRYRIRISKGSLPDRESLVKQYAAFTKN